jgi:hypothetical protein
MFKSGSVFILATFLVFGCATVNYVGNSFGPTTSIDTYFSEDEITQEYTVIGHAIGSGVWASSDVIQAKLIEEAKLKGADAILITGMGRSNVITGPNTSAPENQINASFLKYK